MQTEEGETCEGVTTLLTEHSITVFLDDGKILPLGSRIRVSILHGGENVELKGVVTGVSHSRNKVAATHTLEILEFVGKETEYWQILYDRVPTLPQSLHRDFGVLSHLWQNIAHRVARMRK